MVCFCTFPLYKTSLTLLNESVLQLSCWCVITPPRSLHLCCNQRGS